MATPKLALIPTGYKAGKLYSVLPESGVGDFTVVRATEATRVNEEGLIETMGANVPRLDYSGGGCPVLLTESQRTNLVTYSEDFSNWSISNATTSSNQSISPDGTLNADEITDSSGAYGNFASNSASFSSADYSISLFIKKKQTTSAYLGIEVAGTGSYLTFNSVSGDLKFIGTNVFTNKKLISFNSDWWHLSFNVNTALTTTTAIRIFPSISINGSTLNSGATGTETIWGAQVEQGSYPTSYIKTEGSAVTRNGDQVNGAGDAATFNDSEGVLMMEIEIPNKSTTDSYPIAIFGTGATLQIYYRASSQSISFLSSVGGIQYLFHSTINPLGNHKLSLVYKQGQYSAFIDGFLMNRQNSGNVPSNGTLNTLSIKDSGSSNFYGRVKQIQYFNTVLTDSELETLTSWTSFIEMAQAQNYNII